MNKERTLVSIIIPIYNVCNYLQQCLDSVINQTYESLDIILVDDGSTDECGRICDSYMLSDSRIRVFHTTNNGLSAARNLGLMESRGDYIIFLDSDDWIEHDTVETSLNAALKNKADIISFRYVKEYVGRTIYPKANRAAVEEYNKENILEGFFKGLFGSVIWNKMYSRECISNLIFPVNHNHEDVATTWEIYTRLAQHDGIIIVLDSILHHFRVRQSSITHNRSLDNIRDGWTSVFERFLGMSKYQDLLIPSCFSVIGQMMCYYYSFSDVEKDKAREIIREMNQFSKRVFISAIKGDYSLPMKFICVLSRFNNPLLMRICYFVNQFRHRLLNRRLKLFD